MKYILATLSLGMIFTTSCRHDLDYKRGYDIPSYFNGSDPNINLLTVTPELSVMIPFIGEHNLLEDLDEWESPIPLSLRLVRPPQKSEELRLIRSVLPKRLEANYSDYTLASSELFPASSSIQLKPESGSSMKQSIKLQQLSSVKGKTILPLVATLHDGSHLKLSEQSELTLVKLEPRQTFWLSVMKPLVAHIALGNSRGAILQEVASQLSLAVGTLDKLEGYKVKLVRKDALFETRPSQYESYSLAPDRIFADVEAVELSEEVAFKIQLENIASLREEKSYLLPLQVIVLKGDKEIIPPAEQSTIYVPIHCEETALSLVDSAEGTKLDRSSWSITGEATDSGDIFNPSNLISNGKQFFARKASVLTLDLGQELAISSIELKKNWDYYALSRLAIAVSSDGTSWRSLYRNNSVQWEGSSYILKPFESLSARYLKLSVGTDDDILLISDLFLYTP